MSLGIFYWPILADVLPHHLTNSFCLALFNQRVLIFNLLPHFGSIFPGHIRLDRLQYSGHEKKNGKAQVVVT